MTNFQFDRSYIGVAYETISNRKWSPDQRQWAYGKNVTHTKDNIRLWISTIISDVATLDDMRLPQLYWSPDGYVKIPIDTIERGFDLHEHCWSDGSEPQGKHVALIGDVVDGVTVYGPFDDGEAANDWGRESDDQWCVTTLRVPT